MSPNLLENFAEHTKIIRLYPRPIVTVKSNSFLNSKAKDSNFLKAFSASQVSNVEVLNLYGINSIKNNQKLFIISYKHIRIYFSRYYFSLNGLSCQPTEHIKKSEKAFTTHPWLVTNRNGKLGKTFNNNFLKFTPKYHFYVALKHVFGNNTWLIFHVPSG